MTWVLVVTTTGAAAVLWLQTAVLLPWAARTFDEYGVALPAVTRQVVGVGRSGVAGWCLSAPVLLAIAVVGWWLVRTSRRGPGRGSVPAVLMALMLVGLVTANGVVGVALLLPLQKLQEGLSK